MPIPSAAMKWGGEMHNVWKWFKMSPHFLKRFKISRLIWVKSTVKNPERNRPQSRNLYKLLFTYYFVMMGGPSSNSSETFFGDFQTLHCEMAKATNYDSTEAIKKLPSANAKLGAKWGQHRQGWLLAFKDLSSFWLCRLSKNTNGRWYSDWADWGKGVLRAPAFSSLSLASTLTEKLTYGRCPSMSRLKR